MQVSERDRAEDAVDEALTGLKSALAVKIYGPDLNVLQGKALEIKRRLSQVPGFTELTVVRELGLPEERTNPNGSGVSLGHPIGATGAILTVKALYELRRTGGRYALVTMCIGGGQGIATVLEAV